MPRGKSYPEETKEQARARVAAGESKSKVAKDLGVAISTLSGWLGQAENDAHRQARADRKKQFIQKAWDVIEDALDLSSQKIKLSMVAAERFEPLLEKLIELLEQNEQVRAREVRDVLNHLGKALNISLTEISTFTGTIFDKQAKANGEEEARFVFEIRGEGDYSLLARALEGLSDHAKREVVDSIRRVRGQASTVH